MISGLRLDISMTSAFALCSRGIALAQLNGPIYAVGGLDDTACFNTVERYDVESDCWTVVQSMNSARGGVAVTAFRVHLITPHHTSLLSTHLSVCPSVEHLMSEVFTISHSSTC